ncbi:MAG: hypothetical protein AAGI07_06720 [Bacteroidota bacterium]
MFKIHLKKTGLVSVFTCLLISTLNSFVFAQFWSEEDENYLYKKEFTYGINFNTNGGLIGGFNFKYTRVINERMYHSFSIEFVNVKDPKEERVPSFLSGNTFVPGKQNHLYIIRPQYGREIVLFKKAKKQGVQVNWNNAVGPTIGLQAPYLIQYRFPNNIIRTEQFDPAVHENLNEIVGTGSFFESLGQSVIKPGASLKSSLSFEFGTFKTNVTGFEACFLLDTFFSETRMMYSVPSKQVYTSAFVTLFYGFRK